jgi:hypothetical protein
MGCSGITHTVFSSTRRLQILKNEALLKYLQDQRRTKNYERIYRVKSCKPYQRVRTRSGERTPSISAEQVTGLLPFSRDILTALFP